MICTHDMHINPILIFILLLYIYNQIQNQKGADEKEMKKKRPKKKRPKKKTGEVYVLNQIFIIPFVLYHF